MDPKGLGQILYNYEYYVQYITEISQLILVNAIRTDIMIWDTIQQFIAEF